MASSLLSALSLPPPLVGSGGQPRPIASLQRLERALLHLKQACVGVGVGRAAQKEPAVGAAATVEGVDPPPVDSEKVRVPPPVVPLVGCEVCEDVACSMEPETELRPAKAQGSADGCLAGGTLGRAGARFSQRDIGEGRQAAETARVS